MVNDSPTINWKDYNSVIDWLFNQLPNYQAQGTSAYKPGLDTIEKFLKTIGNPHNKFKSVHIAGTNGKGSVAHIMAAIYQKNGYKTGVFSSPHISDFRERVKINGSYIPQKDVVDFLKTNFRLIQELEVTFFEITTALAFTYFAKEEVDIALVETGLGGRLDATNVLYPELSVITSIGMDHMQFLGDNLTSIAKEKAGIIKPKTPVVIGDLIPEAEKAVREKATECEVELIKAKPANLPSDLVASYQEQNKGIAITAIESLEHKFPVDQEKLKQALLQVTALTGFRARFQKIQSDPTIIVDVAHNADGVKALFKEIKALSYDRLHLIYGTSADKDLQAVFDQFPKDAAYYFTTFDSPRSLSVEAFEKLAKQYQLNHQLFKKPQKALELAKTVASASDLIIVFGSFYIMSAVFQDS
ncbi:MAG: folylpolyglutamate synthase/dihydrofolate synthase family protein [Crocinitomicaceae bacterium]